MTRAKPLVLETTWCAWGDSPQFIPGGQSEIKVFEVGGLDEGYREIEVTVPALKELSSIWGNKMYTRDVTYKNIR